MSALRYGEAFIQDLARVERHLQAHDAADIPARMAEIFEGLGLLERHPLIGREVAGGRRELVIGRGRRGYVALYRFDPMDDEAIVLALRAQRESGYGDGT